MSVIDNRFSDHTGVPQHIAIIMDGNGRWAKNRHLPRIEGHRRGVNAVRKVVECLPELGVRHLTLYAFSVENWQRPTDEVNELMQLLKVFLRKYTKELLKHDVRLRVVGDIRGLPEDAKAELVNSMDLTQHLDYYSLNLALNYGARTEVVDAVKAYTQAALDGKENLSGLDWNKFSGYLYTRNIPDPDLLIRTSGETRISNFLLLQCAYAELYFTSVHWPDFGKQDLEEAIDSYKKRERRFGMTEDQLKQSVL